MLAPQDLKQHKDRDQWYIARFVADDAPDWNAGSFARTKETAPGLRTVVVEAEISREKVPLRNAYMHVGQKASVRVNSGPARELTGAVVFTCQYACASMACSRLVMEAITAAAGDWWSISVVWFRIRGNGLDSDI